MNKRTYTDEELIRRVWDVEEIKKLANKRVEKVEDVVNIGDMIWVKVTDIDEKGRVNLSHKDAVKEIRAKEAAVERVK